MKRLFIVFIHLYRVLLSPFIGQQCRFYPSCSHYTEEAIEHHGCFKGLFLGAMRILKCHPWHPGGFDPVPLTQESRQKNTNSTSNYETAVEE